MVAHGDSKQQTYWSSAVLSQLDTAETDRADFHAPCGIAAPWRQAWPTLSSAFFEAARTACSRCSSDASRSARARCSVILHRQA